MEYSKTSGTGPQWPHKGPHRYRYQFKRHLASMYHMANQGSIIDAGRMSAPQAFIADNNVTFRHIGPVSVMSVTLKLSDSNDFMDVNYKGLLKEFKGSDAIKTVEKKSKEKRTVGSKGGISGEFLARLERKWCGYGYHEADNDNDDNEQDDDSDSGSDAEDANNNNGETSLVFTDNNNNKKNNNNNNNPVKKKKRRYRDDVYDHEDWFVDDTEDAVVMMVEAKRIETKHSGFFVSEGSLDVNTTRSVAVKKPLTASDGVKESSAVASKASLVKPKIKMTSQPTNGGGSALSQYTTPLNTSYLLAPSTSPTRNVSGGSNEKQVGGAEEKHKRTRTVMQKPEYIATENVKARIDVVKEEVKRLRAMNDNKKFHYIPDALDCYLLPLDDLVHQHHPEIYRNTHIGYFEEISHAILDVQKPKVMKSYLACIRAKREANNFLQECTRLTDELVHEAKNSIVPFVATSNTEISNETNELMTDSQPQIDMLTDAAKSKLKVDYKWTCAWKPVMRSLLAAIDRNIQFYVLHCNLCLSNMSNHQKEKLLPEEVANIDGKVYITTHLKAIISRGFPEACKNGDMTYLRTIISQEKNKELKKSGTKSTSHSPMKVSTIAPSTEEERNVKRKPDEIKSSEPHKKAMKVDVKLSVKQAVIINEPLKGTNFRQIEFNMEDFTCIN